jgi:hypothetical protein
MQTLKEKPRKWHGEPASLGISHQQYFALSRFYSQAEALGLKVTDLDRGPLGQGCILKLRGRHDYELRVDGTGFMLLGRTEKDGKRTRLYNGSTSTEAGWNRVLAALKASEGMVTA